MFSRFRRLFIILFLAGWAINILPADAAVILITIIQNPINVPVPISDLTLGGNVASDDAQVFGTISVNHATTLYISISSTQVVFNNGHSTFTATVRGTIGNTPVSVVPVPIVVDPANPAPINLILDIDEGSLSQSKQAGLYAGSTFQILASE